MIVYLSTERFSTTIRYFVDFFRDRLRGVIVPLSYEELFFEGAAPVGDYIFTDFDRLSRYELESAVAFAGALTEHAPEARILNHPLKVLERYPLLVALHKAGINKFSATRLETCERPPRYPVFIRAEDGFGGAETDLIKNDAEFDAALESLTRRALPRRGRLAVGYANELGSDGLYRKYGAFKIANRIVPHDLMYGRSWVVKVRAGQSVGHDAEYGDSSQGLEEELHYIRGNPHRDVLRRAFAVAGIDYGRADYGVVKGHVQIYEINTNPHLPHQPSPDKRLERRDILDRGLIAAIEAIDTPLGIRGRLKFDMPRPRLHNLHWPRRRLPVSLLRRAVDLIARR